jgi:hypothetical protein
MCGQDYKEEKRQKSSCKKNAAWINKASLFPALFLTGGMTRFSGDPAR